MTQSLVGSSQETRPLRFVGCSATIPNAADLAEWLGTPNRPALLFQSASTFLPDFYSRALKQTTSLGVLISIINL